MISKEVFIEVMERISNLDMKMNRVDAALNELCPDFCGLYIPETSDIISDLLTEVFNDKDGWINYCMYDLNYLTTYHDGMVTDANNVVIDLSSWGKVYDFLIKNMEG